ncbi:unnamed protein product [Ceutorhynchus assimilis]|uniref:Uncharacterized protein n=1 Tax=Ceutorhynchus assimilis TaxID=467358 RepID=A0A9N9QSI6_9CUCU|nr:unnamed protein product [Ceutorhynchus assimilis]
MSRHLVLLVLVAFAQANPQNEDIMSLKIKGIAQGIVDKWIKEGLTVTRDKVEGWLAVLDTTQNEKEFKQVKNTLVNTFTNIGKAKCKNCDKPEKNLENLSLEDLMQKQQAIKKLQKMVKTLTTPNEEL